MDLLRPEISFQNVMQRRIDKWYKSDDAERQPKATDNEAPAVASPVAKFDERAELEQVNVLYSFIENRYSKKVGVLMSAGEIG